MQALRIPDQRLDCLAGAGHADADGDIDKPGVSLKPGSWPAGVFSEGVQEDRPIQECK